MILSKQDPVVNQKIQVAQDLRQDDDLNLETQEQNIEKSEENKTKLKVKNPEEEDPVASFDYYQY